MHAEAQRILDPALLVHLQVRVVADLHGGQPGIERPRLAGGLVEQPALKAHAGGNGCAHSGAITGGIAPGQHRAQDLDPYRGILAVQGVGIVWMAGGVQRHIFLQCAVCCHGMDDAPVAPVQQFPVIRFARDHEVRHIALVDGFAGAQRGVTGLQAGHAAGAAIGVREDEIGHLFLKGHHQAVTACEQQRHHAGTHGHAPGPAFAATHLVDQAGFKVSGGGEQGLGGFTCGFFATQHGLPPRALGCRRFSGVAVIPRSSRPWRGPGLVGDRSAAREGVWLVEAGERLPVSPEFRRSCAGTAAGSHHASKGDGHAAPERGCGIKRRQVLSPDAKK